MKLILKKPVLRYFILLIIFTLTINKIAFAAKSPEPGNVENKEHTSKALQNPQKDEQNSSPWLELEDPFYTFYLKVDKVFEDMNKNFGQGFFNSRSSFSSFKPNMDIISNDKEYKVMVGVPGLEEKDIKIKLIDHSLIIEGQKTVEKEEKASSATQKSYTSFQRVLSLPKNANEDGIKAKIKNGLLTITIDKKQIEEEKAKIIDIHTEK